MNDSNDSREAARLAALLEPERALWDQGTRLVAGLDEVGRGPLAGPVVAAAVIFPPTVWISGIDDSKKLDLAKRERLNGEILAAALSVGLGLASAQEIDELNILQASLLAMRRAVENLSIQPQHLLIDGQFTLPNCDLPQTALIHGDARSFSIAAASIVAKVQRDRLMGECHVRFPRYRFDRHKGYPTPAHIAALSKYGYCELHRRSFKVKGLDAPVEKASGG